MKLQLKQKAGCITSYAEGTLNIAFDRVAEWEHLEKGMKTKKGEYKNCWGVDVFRKKGSINSPLR